MKKRIFPLIFSMAIGIIFAGCGGGGDDSSSSSGTISMNVTDAKPVLPAGVEKVLITFDEVSVHKSGGGWTSLTLPKTPFTIDLYQFIEGKTTQLVPPVQLESGKYTQIRVGVISAMLETASGSYSVEIPSQYLKTNKNFEFTVQGGGAVDLTVDFDLSQSIVVTGTNTYQLKPVLHLTSTTEAWTIKGNITSSSIGDPPEKAVVVVTWDKDNSGDLNSGDEEYTRLSVTKGSSTSTEFTIFWLVPNESYYVQVYLGDPNESGILMYEEPISKSASAWTSKIYYLKGGVPLF